MAVRDTIGLLQAVLRLWSAIPLEDNRPIRLPPKSQGHAEIQRLGLWAPRQVVGKFRGVPFVEATEAVSNV